MEYFPYATFATCSPRPSPPPLPKGAASYRSWNPLGFGSHPTVAVTLSKLPNLSEPQIAHLENEATGRPPPKGFFWKELVYVKYSEEVT